MPYVVRPLFCLVMGGIKSSFDDAARQNMDTM
jgi:hypothetical protein